jgi:UDP-glucuronate 4-epimerase
LNEVFRSSRLERVIHLATQAGAHYSLKNSLGFIQNNLVGFVNILEAFRQNESEYLVCTSISSACGANATAPFLVH